MGSLVLSLNKKMTKLFQIVLIFGIFVAISSKSVNNVAEEDESEEYYYDIIIKMPMTTWRIKIAMKMFLTVTKDMETTKKVKNFREMKKMVMKAMKRTEKRKKVKVMV